ncbi:hypothetical protein FOL47_006325 [Perkinsus chesapeaki]|uniref:Uncharacterized protein n=1 Tax=Perkinsus chesapeaki TaxID=330153 RepID=A0A7J6LSU2_PERCH|nr:hypothetical protein FOL47_006325 [Perkinsus chesapeaki]
MPDYRSAGDEYLRVAFLESRGRTAEIAGYVAKMSQLCGWYLGSQKREVKPDFVDEAHGLISAQQARNRVESMFQEIVALQSALSTAVETENMIRETYKMTLCNLEEVFLAVLRQHKCQFNTLLMEGENRANEQKRLLRRAVRETAERYHRDLQEQTLWGNFLAWRLWTGACIEGRYKVALVEDDLMRVNIQFDGKIAELRELHGRVRYMRLGFVEALAAREEEGLLGRILARWRVWVDSRKHEREIAAKDDSKFIQERQELLEKIRDLSTQYESTAAELEETRLIRSEVQSENDRLGVEISREIGMKEALGVELESSKVEVEVLRKDLQSAESQLSVTKMRLDRYEDASAVESPIRMIVEQQELIEKLQRERLALLKRLQIGGEGPPGQVCQFMSMAMEGPSSFLNSYPEEKASSDDICPAQDAMFTTKVIMCNHKIVARARIPVKSRSSRGGGLWTSTSTCCDSWMERSHIWGEGGPLDRYAELPWAFLEVDQLAFGPGPLTSSLNPVTEKVTCTTSFRRTIGPARKPARKSVTYYPERYGSQLDGTSLMAHRQSNGASEPASAKKLTSFVESASGLTGERRVSINSPSERKLVDACRFYGPRILGKRRVAERSSGMRDGE